MIQYGKTMFSVKQSSDDEDEEWPAGALSPPLQLQGVCTGISVNQRI